jgi:hypothetical protein
MKKSEYSSKSEETALDLSIATELHRTESNILETFKKQLHVKFMNV